MMNDDAVRLTVGPGSATTFETLWPTKCQRSLQNETSRLPGIRNYSALSRTPNIVRAFGPDGRGQTITTNLSCGCYLFPIFS
ncbi:hypothetical protein V2G26_009658 [Clonostachys chloroleuca]